MKKSIGAALISLAFLSSAYAAMYNLELNTTEKINDITTSTDLTKVIAVGESSTLRKSTDMGKTWSTITTDANITFNKVAYPSATTAYAAGYATSRSGVASGKLIKIVNGTASDITSDLDANVGVINDVVFINENLGYAVGKRYTYWPPMYDGSITTSTAYKYANGTWSKLSNAPTSSGDFVAAAAYDADNVWFIQNLYSSSTNTWNTYVYTTTDGGTTFQFKKKWENTKLNDLSFKDSNTIIFVGDNGYAVKYTIAANSLETLTTGLTANLNSIDASSSANFIISGDRGTLARYDGSTTFTSISSGTTSNLRNIKVLDENLYFVAAEDNKSRMQIDSQPDKIVLTTRNTLKEVSNDRTSQITITGRNLTPDFTLTNLGNATIRNINYISPQEIKVELVVPESATTGNVTPGFRNTYGDVADFDQQLTIRAKPAVTNAAPEGRITLGSTNKRLIINGTGFRDDMTYRPAFTFKRSGQTLSDITVRKITVDSANKMTVDIDVPDTVGAGTVDVTLTNPDLATTDFEIEVVQELSTDGPVISNLYFDGKRYGASYGTTKKYDIISSTPTIRAKISDGDLVSASTIALSDGLDAIPDATITAATYDAATETYTGKLTDPLLGGVHVLKIEAQDSLGNTGSTNVRVRVYDEVKIVEGTSPVVSPTPVSGNTVTIAYALTKEPAEGVEIMAASPTGGIIVKQTFNTVNAAGIKAGYSAGYNEIQVSVPADLGSGIYPGYIRDRGTGKPLAKFYIVVSISKYK